MVTPPSTSVTGLPSITSGSCRFFGRVTEAGDGSGRMAMERNLVIPERRPLVALPGRALSESQLR